MKANSSIRMRLEMAGMTQNKQKCLIFIVVPRVRVEIKSVELVSY